MKARRRDGSRHTKNGGMRLPSRPLVVGTMTKYGEICAVGFRDGERYYMMGKGREVALMPAAVVEDSL